MLQPFRSGEPRLAFFNGGANSRSTYSAHEMRRIVKSYANGTVSNSGASTYPQDGISGNYWYTYQASDSIDAAAVGYSNQSPMGGQPHHHKRHAYDADLRRHDTLYIPGAARQRGVDYHSDQRHGDEPAVHHPGGDEQLCGARARERHVGLLEQRLHDGHDAERHHNLPPSAPGSISFGEPVAGDACTITWGAATDSDGTVTGYELERNVDGGDSWDADLLRLPR